MRLTTDQILEKFPSMNMSGKNYHNVQAQYYGDHYTDKKPLTLHCDSSDRTIQNIESVDHFIAQCYFPDEVYKYQFCHGEGYLRRHDSEDIVIAGNISIRYGNGHAYNISIFNNHMGIDGFHIWKGDTGKVTIIAYASSDVMWNSLPTKAVREIIDKETIEKIFHKIETDDEYGYIAQKLIQCAKGMLGGENNE